MTLKECIDREFARLESLGNVNTTGGVLSVDTDNGQLESQLTQLDDIGCVFQGLLLKTNRLADASLDRLKRISDSLSSRLSYLLEPIALIESDSDACVVQLRSNPPQKDDRGTNYYELVVRRGGQLYLCRYEKTRGNARQVIPASVTREVFLRLATDFDGAISSLR